jgi:hypothetical protein
MGRGRSSPVPLTHAMLRGLNIAQSDALAAIRERPWGADGGPVDADVSMNCAEPRTVGLLCLVVKRSCARGRPSSPGHIVEGLAARYGRPVMDM